MMTVTDFARLGGRARWKKTTKKQRKDAMTVLANIPRKKKRAVKSVKK